MNLKEKDAKCQRLSESRMRFQSARKLPYFSTLHKRSQWMTEAGRCRSARMAGVFAFFLLLSHNVQAWPIPDRDLPSRDFDYNQSVRERQYDALRENQRNTDRSNTPLIGDVTGPTTLAVGDRILIKGMNLGSNPIVYLGSVRLPLLPDASARGLTAVVSLEAVLAIQSSGGNRTVLTVARIGTDGTVYRSLPFGLQVNGRPSVTSWAWMQVRPGGS